FTVLSSSRSQFDSLWTIALIVNWCGSLSWVYDLMDPGDEVMKNLLDPRGATLVLGSQAPCFVGLYLSASFAVRCATLYSMHSGCFRSKKYFHSLCQFQMSCEGTLLSTGPSRTGKLVGEPSQQLQQIPNIRLMAFC